MSSKVGLEILQACVEQSTGGPAHGVLFRICEEKSTKVSAGCYICTVTLVDKLVEFYHVADFESFAAQHQFVLNANPKLNGFEATLHILKRRYRLCSFSL